MAADTRATQACVTVEAQEARLLLLLLVQDPGDSGGDSSTLRTLTCSTQIGGAQDLMGINKQINLYS